MNKTIMPISDVHISSDYVKKIDFFFSLEETKESTLKRFEKMNTTTHIPGKKLKTLCDLSLDEKNINLSKQIRKITCKECKDKLIKKLRRK